MTESELERRLSEAPLTKAQVDALKFLGQEPIGFHFANDPSDRAIFGALARLGLARKVWNYGAWTFILTEAGIRALATQEPTNG